MPDLAKMQLNLLLDWEGVGQYGGMSETTPFISFLLLCVLQWMQVEEVVSSAKFGDLIEYTYPIGYSHWAVYDDEGYVFHFAVAGEDYLQYISFGGLVVILVESHPTTLILDRFSLSK